MSASGAMQRLKQTRLSGAATASRVRRLRGWIAVLALAALARAALPGVDALYALRDLVYMRAANWADFERRLTLPGSGLEILPPAVTGAAALLRDHHVDRYRLTPQLVDDGFLLQRISEVTWPAQIDWESKFVLRLEAEPQVCMTVAIVNGVALDRCD